MFRRKYSSRLENAKLVKINYIKKVCNDSIRWKILIACRQQCLNIFTVVSFQWVKKCMIFSAEFIG